MRTQIPINIVSEGLDFQLHPRQQTIIFLDAGNLLPVYPSTDGLAQRSIRTATRKSLDAGLPLLTEFLDDDLRQRHSFPGLPEASDAMHYPD